MAQKTSARFPRVDYSKVDIYVEEFKNIENHRPSMVTCSQIDFTKRKRVDTRIRIIPSKKWVEDPSIELDCAGLLAHESLHTWLLFNFGTKETSQMDNLPEPTSIDEFLTGAFDWNLNSIEWKYKVRES